MQDNKIVISTVVARRVAIGRYASFRLDRKNYFYVSTFLHFYVSTEKVSSHYNFP